MNASSRNNDHCGGNEDMHGNRPMWIIAANHNAASRFKNGNTTSVVRRKCKQYEKVALL